MNSEPSIASLFTVFYVNALVAIAASICDEEHRRGSNCAVRCSETGEAENFLKGNFIFTNFCVF